LTPLGDHAANVAWEASLKIEDADPGWTDSDARPSYAGLAHLRDVVFSHLLSKVPMRRTSVLADVLAVKGDPTQHIEAMQEVQFVMKGGKIYKWPSLPLGKLL